MSKSFMLIAVMLASIVLAPGEASAMSRGQGSADCSVWGGVMRWNSTPLCPFCSTCFACSGVDRTGQCIYIACDLKECDEIILRKSPTKPPRLYYKR